MKVIQHPLMEIIARKLSGIEGVPRSAQTRMVSAACHAARIYHDAEIDRLRAELRDTRTTAEFFKARVAELEAERDEQSAVLREATQKLVELNVKNAVLKEKLRTAEDFNENYTVIDDIGPLPKCFHCAHQQSMAFRGPDAPCYQCGIDKGYPKFKADKP